MLFESSIRRELARSFGAALVVILTVVITMMLVRSLGQASRGEVDPQALVLFMTYGMLGQLGVVLTVALIIAVASTLSRMYRDSEMVIWHMSGLGLGRFVRPVVRFAWPIWVAIAALMAFAAPWSQQQRDEMRARYEQRSDLERIAPGQFQESSGGRRVFFIDRDTQNGRAGRNVFIVSVERDGSESIVSARTGRVVMQDGVTYLVLENGQRLWRAAPSNLESQETLQLSEFEQHWQRVHGDSATATYTSRRGALPTLVLLRDGSPASRAELAWRAGMVISAINLALLAIAAAASNPRAGKSGNLLFMLLAFITYYNLLNLGNDWIARERVGALSFMLALHGGAALGALLWMAHREHPWTLRLRRRTQACV
ncbi:MAG: LPS export ABC transporter permease LptF [Tepidimonas sp.]|uniref:LPS export ABC transporter permease LptF n=1 Tax=Tepidimonas sp. TaxID=2002775 RepID=UPI00259E361B|nr:LPS export ABC transporter permease LptF [Tepidimonas sp.]MDM7455760.1 LPS export ABC transporter permease LptF [Tepidimonas sp.]